MRSSTTGLLLAAVFLGATGVARAEPVAINQGAWLNYAVIVSTDNSASEISINQAGAKNGVAAIQRSGDSTASLTVHQSGHDNVTTSYQSGWYTLASVTQEAPRDMGASRNAEPNYTLQKTDDGYLSYFMAGGFSIVSLTDQDHTWTIRFGRAR